MYNASSKMDEDIEGCESYKETEHVRRTRTNQARCLSSNKADSTRLHEVLREDIRESPLRTGEIK